MKSSRHSGNSVHCPRSASSTKRLINSPIESRENHNSSPAFSHSQGQTATLVVHTRRGPEGVIRDGRHAGGRAYGYRALPHKPGELESVEDEAAIVREIFARYIAGETPRAIAHDLNKRGVRPARGRIWNASTINGNVSRGGGMILNDLYAGRIVWNKVRMIKHPVTRKRLSRPIQKINTRSSMHRICGLLTTRHSGPL
jgi:hypothetical protein